MDGALLALPPLEASTDQPRNSYPAQAQMKPPRRPQSQKMPDQNSMVGSTVELLDLGNITPEHKRVLQIIIGITASLFLLEMAAGHIFSSHALQADALDFLDDMLIYALSLAVVGTGLRMRVAAATFKAGLLCIMSLWVLVSAICHLHMERLPSADVMGIVGVLGVAANALCQALLARFGQPADYLRIDGASVRHDMVGSAAVVVTAGGVWVMESAWPDLLVAIAAASHLLWLSVQTLRQASTLYRAS